MRVLELSWEYPPIIAGGLARHVQGLSEALVGQGVGVHVLSRGPTETVTHGRGITVQRVAQPQFPRDMDAFLVWVATLNRTLVAAASTLIAARRFDVIHSHDWLVADAARAISGQAGLPWVATIHATEHGRHGGFIARPPQSTIHAAERAMAHDADQLITCSEWMRGHVAAVFGVAPDTITTLPNGIDPADLSPVPDGLGTVHPRLAGGNERLVLLAGRLVHEKGFDLALDALAPIVRARGSVRFIVAGAGPAETTLRERCARLRLTSNGQFLGWVDDRTLHALYRACDVCVVPSRYEPFGIVALEAMACGCPCVVADTGGLREIVPGDGTVGLRVACDDSVALGAAITRLLDDDALRARLGAEARRHARSFGWAGVARATAELFDRVVSDLSACSG
jgi:glycogen(starch) synthase